MKGANGFLADAIQCKRWMASAAIQGHIEAEYHMAKMLLAGVHVKKSLPEAFRHFIRAASKGHVESMAIAGHMLLNASGTDPDDAEAFKWLSKAAKAGNLRAMCDLGYMYADGKVPSGSKDLHVAMRLAERAGSEQSAYAAKSQRLAGSLEAENNNFDCAYEWFLKAAQSGDKDGMASLGRLMVQRLYKNFVGNSCNLAIKDKLQGSDSLVGYDNLGEENANDYNLISLGEIDKNGKDLRFKEGTINLVKSAEFWLKKAADVGHKGAQKDLGFLYVDGHRIGAKIDIKQSVFYLSTAGLFGMPDAYLRLAEIFATGQLEIKQDFDKAKHYIKEARREARENNLPTLKIDTWRLLFDEPQNLRRLIDDYERSGESGRVERVWTGGLKQLRDVWD